MQRSRWGACALFLVLTGNVRSEAPSAPTYAEVERGIAQIEASWQTLNPEANPQAESWRTFFSAVRNDLRTYATATDPNVRVAALNRLHQDANALNATTWTTAAQLRDDLKHWLRPRVALSWAEYNLLAATPRGSEQRAKTQQLIDETLRPAISRLEGAQTAAARADATREVEEAIAVLRQPDRLPSGVAPDPLLGALASLYSNPNFEVIIDQSALSGLVLPEGLVNPEWVFFRGQWSLVTPGPVTGVGFVPSVDGIQVVINQALTSQTQIQGFQEQIAADPQGRRAAKLYQFSASTQNNSILQMVVLFRLATGLQLAPGYQHGISAAISSAPQSGGGFGRLIASLVGYGQRRITNEVYENAFPRMQQEVVSGAQELSGIRSGEQAARVNAQIRPYIVDGRTVATGNFGVTDLLLQTQPNYAYVAGTVYSPLAPEPRRASAPQPRSFLTYQPGITADVHLPTVLGNVVRGLYQTSDVQQTQTVLVEAGGGPEGAEPTPRVTRNADFATFLKLVREAQDQNKTIEAIRLIRPVQPPDFVADARGNLVVLVPDFQADVPAPPNMVRGGLAGPAARVFRVTSPRAEINLQISLNRDNPAVPELKAKVVGVDLGTNLRVVAIQEDESNPVAVNPFVSRIISGAFTSRLVGQQFDLPLSAVNRPEMALVDVSQLDPSGWMRLLFTPR